MILAVLSACTQSTEAPLDALRARSEQPVQVLSERAWSMWVPVAEGDPVDVAYAFVEEFAPLYGFADPRSELVPARVHRSSIGEHVTFEQKVDGMPVFD